MVSYDIHQTTKIVTIGEYRVCEIFFCFFFVKEIMGCLYIPESVIAVRPWQALPRAISHRLEMRARAGEEVAGRTSIRHSRKLPG